MVFGRLKGVEVPGRARVVQFELTKAGLVFREKGTRKARATTLSFERLAAGGGVTAQVLGSKATFTLTAGGVEVRRDGSRSARVVSYEAVLNQSEGQPWLFPDLVAKPAQEVAA